MFFRFHKTISLQDNIKSTQINLETGFIIGVETFNNDMCKYILGLMTL